MAELSKTTAVTFRCPAEIVDTIDYLSKTNHQSKTDVLVDFILGSIPNVLVTKRLLLPPAPAIYFVFTPNKRLLYVGKTDNLQKRWNNHHKYQHFIETNIECRIGYFLLDSVDDVEGIVEEFKSDSNSTEGENILVTVGQLNELRQELYALKRTFEITFSSLSSFGLEKLIKRFEMLKPPSGLKDWEPTDNDLNQGIVSSNLMKHFGFATTSDLENAASFYNLSPEEYLEQLSGWEYRPIKEGSTRFRFFPV